MTHLEKSHDFSRIQHPCKMALNLFSVRFWESPQITCVVLTLIFWTTLNLYGLTRLLLLACDSSAQILMARLTSSGVQEVHSNSSDWDLTGWVGLCWLTALLDLLLLSMGDSKSMELRREVLFDNLGTEGLFLMGGNLDEEVEASFRETFFRTGFVVKIFVDRVGCLVGWIFGLTQKIQRI